MNFFRTTDTTDTTIWKQALHYQGKLLKKKLVKEERAKDDMC